MHQDKIIRSFEDLTVWQKADELWNKVSKDCSNFPNNRVSWILTDQLLRSVGSISANIAEGFGSGYTNEYIRVLRIARKECYESVNWLIKVRNQEFITEDKLRTYRELTTEILKMLNKLITNLNNKTN